MTADTVPLTEIVWEELAHDGGWLTSQGVHLLIPNRTEGVVRDRLVTLHRAGRVEKRLIEMSYPNPRGQFTTIRRIAEYRAVT